MDRREHQRNEIGAGASLRVGEATVQCCIVNISAGGTLITVSRDNFDSLPHKEIGQEVEIIINGDNPHRGGPGRVIRCVESGDLVGIAVFFM